MSMLAERKRKQKWSLNPRGKDWAQDTNKFGQKMLEKMGWTHGKGLGAKENGVIEHIKVNYKNDSKGMGYKESDDQWTEHESNFTALLKTLGGSRSNTENVKLSSLEEKSQSSRARVHYKKFTRGKDLSRYSEKDLANIFGRKSLKEPNQIEKMDIPEEKPSEIEKTDGVFFSNCGSMSDYFKKKIPNFGKVNGFIVGNNGVLKKEDETESESELTRSFGLGFKDSDSRNSDNTTAKSYFISHINEKNEDLGPKQKNKMKKRFLEEHIDNTPTKKKKIEDGVHKDTPVKKRSKSKKKDKEENGLSNPAFDPVYSPVKVEKHYLETIEETLNDSLNSTMGQVAETFEVTVQIHNENSPKKKCKSSGIDLQQFKDSSFNEVNEQFKPEKKKKEQTSFIEPDTPLKKKKKKKTNGEMDLDNSLHNISEDKNVPVLMEYKCESPIKEKRKKKKKSKHDEQYGLENPVFNEEEHITSMDLTNGEFEIKRKDKSKKKKKEKMQEIGLDNPALNLNDSVEEDCDLMLNIVTTPVSKNKTEKTTESGLEMKIKITEVSRRKSVRFSDVTRERIIPNKDDIDQVSFKESSEIFEVEGKLNDSTEISLKKNKKHRKGLENSGFDYQANSIEENITSISNTLDSYEAEIENDMNEAKLKTVELSEVMVGEVGNPEGENEMLNDGSVKLKFKYAQFRKHAAYMDALTGPKKSYKHLIKGDIVVGFKHTNMHEIGGYAIKDRK